MSVKERLKEYLKYEDISIITFEKSINASNGYVNSISKSIGIDKLDTIIENYPNLNIEWLLTGRSTMLKASLMSTETLINIDYKELADARKIIIDYNFQEINRLKNEIEILKNQESSQYSQLVAESASGLIKKKGK